jgi:hypothetical protein
VNRSPNGNSHQIYQDRHQISVIKHDFNLPPRRTHVGSSPSRSFIYAADSFFMLLLLLLLPLIVSCQQRLRVDLQGGLPRCTCRSIIIRSLLLCIKGRLAREKLFVLHGGDVTP